MGLSLPVRLDHLLSLYGEHTAAQQKYCKKYKTWKKQEIITQTQWVKNNQRRRATHTASLSGKEDTWSEWGKRKERKERCSPWECSSITGRLRPALSHCHGDATTTPPERSPSTSLHCFKHKTHTHCICAFTKRRWTHSHLSPHRWQAAAAAARTQISTDMHTPTVQ